MNMANVAMTGKIIVRGCCRNVETPLQRFPVQQQAVPVEPSSVYEPQPFAPPGQVSVPVEGDIVRVIVN